MQLANVLEEKVKPDGLAIVIEADHFYMHWRGVKDADSRMTNSVIAARSSRSRPAARVSLAAQQEEQLSLT